MQACKQFDEPDSDDRSRSKETTATSKQDNMESLDLTKVLMKLSDTISAHGVSRSKEQEIRNLTLEINEKQKRLHQHQLILATVKDVVSKEDAVSPTIAQKVNKIIVAEQAAKFFQNCPLDSNPLGLLEHCVSTSESVLLYDESMQLQSVVEEALVEKCNEIKSIEKKEMGSASRLRVDKSKILRLNAELDEANCKYNDSLIQAFNILKEMCDLYVVPMAQINGTRADCLVEELRATELLARTLDTQVTDKIYSEHKNTHEAIDKIDNALKRDMESVAHEVENLKTLKATYDQLAETEQYQKVMKEYREIKKLIQDKKWLIENC